MRKTVALLLAFVPLFGASWTAKGQQSPAGLQEQVDPTQEATIEIEQTKEREEGTGLSVHGVGYLQYFAPFTEPSSVNLFLGQLETQWTNGLLGFYSTFRAKIGDLGKPVDKGYLYFQQAYGFLRHDYGDIKVGKIYSKFGRLWDYGFYGPLVANNDLKLQPDIGISFEGAPPLAGPVDLEYAMQYFPVDGRSFSVNNRQVFSGDNVRRRNLVVMRAAPTLHFSADTSAAVGVSGERYESMKTDGHQVLRGAIDVNVNIGPVTAFVETGRQDGADIVVAKNKRVGSHDYVWTGVQLKLDPVDIRYHFNAVRYQNAARTVEYLHQPGIEVAVTENLSMMGEMVMWTSASSASPGPRADVEKSFYLIAAGKF